MLFDIHRGGAIAFNFMCSILSDAQCFADPCEVGNGGCTHLCLLSATEPSGYSCICPDGVNHEDCSYCEKNKI